MPVNAFNDAVHGILDRLRSMDGLVRACLVEPDSAHVLDIVAGDIEGEAEAGAAILAAGASDVVQVITLLTSSLGDPDGLEDVIITLGRHHHLITPLPPTDTGDLMVVVTLDRARTNLALARRQLATLGPLMAHRGT